MRRLNKFDQRSQLNSSGAGDHWMVERANGSAEGVDGRGTALISQNKFIDQIQKVNSPTESSSYRLLVLVQILR